VVIEGVSLVNNYRSQFSGILEKASFDELSKKLRETVRKQSGG
jgi:phospholipid transport system substrate-binding protein